MFQSTRPRGARRVSTRRAVIVIQFQSTRPRGARLWGFAQEVNNSGFNPRARGGRDLCHWISF